MEKKKSLTTKEIFCGIPYLREYFRKLDYRIKHTAEAEVPILKEKRKNLLQTAKEMDSTDLKILYALRCIRRITARELLLSLEKIVQAQQALKEELQP